MYRYILSMQRVWQKCKKMLTLAKVGKLNGCMIEGMACPGGCMGGAGTHREAPESRTSKELASAVVMIQDSATSKNMAARSHQKATPSPGSFFVLYLYRERGMQRQCGTIILTTKLAFK